MARLGCVSPLLNAATMAAFADVRGSCDEGRGVRPSHCTALDVLFRGWRGVAVGRLRQSR